ncbi:biopolymer transporter ExbD [bacterium]|jgi:biopolymer transport protein TolR|nr:biopolymer transporter ExbD [bacterium]MBT5015276.1 biopolymer transporter ExbD [bacterium]
MRKIRRSKLRKNISVPEVSLTPLIDTALTLLIIFMITAPMMHSVIKVDLPKAKEQAPQDFNKESLMVSIDKAGVIFINKEKVSLSALIDYLKKSLVRDPKNNIVFIHGDKSLPYETIITTFDQVSAIKGIEHVALVTQKTL